MAGLPTWLELLLLIWAGLWLWATWQQARAATRRRRRDDPGPELLP
jgi:hypothetical protein